jgi:hypothetical protein
MKIQPGVGYTFDSSSKGFTFDTSDQFPSIEVTEYRPLYVTNAGGNKFEVSPGTVNRIVPKIGSVYLDASEKPQVTVTASGYICVMLTHETDSFFPRTATIVFHAGSVTPGDTETTGYWPLAKVNVTETEAGTQYETITFSYGNLVCNRLKAGANTAVWYWAAINSQPSV